jgi:hypothetical protein
MSPRRPKRPRVIALVLALAAAAAGLIPPAAAEMRRTFGSVTVLCTDDRYCAAAIQSDGAEPGSVLQLSRSPGSRSRWTLSISTFAALADRDRPVSISIDNGVGVTLRPVSDYAPFVNATDFYVVSQSALDRLMVRLQAGNTLRFSYIDIAGGPHTDRFSLDGLGAAMTDVDRQQGRVVGDRRAGPPEDLPPAPTIDRQAVVAEAGVPERLLEWHAAGSTCEAIDGPSIADVPPVIGPLSETAMLYALPCYRSGERTVYRLYLIESGEIGGMHLLAFAVFSPRFGWMGTDTLHAVAYDADARRLSAEALDAAGCGSRGSWTFDAFAFRLDRFEVADGCANGATPAWRQVWPAK